MPAWDIDVVEPPYGGTTYQIKVNHPLTCKQELVAGRPKVTVVGSKYTFYYVTGPSSTGTDQWDSGVALGTGTTFDFSCIVDNRQPPIHKEKVDVAGGGGGGPRPKSKHTFVGSFKNVKKKFILVPGKSSK